MTLTDLDHRMIRHAAARGVVTVKGDKPRQARLIAWRPTRRGRRTNAARVEFAPNRRATVTLDRIEVEA